MTRRALLLALWTGQTSPKNDVANSANDFTAAYAVWAKMFQQDTAGRDRCF